MSRWMRRHHRELAEVDRLSVPLPPARAITEEEKARGSDAERRAAGVGAAELALRAHPSDWQAAREALALLLDALNLRGPRTVDYLTGPPVNAHTETPR